MSKEVNEIKIDDVNIEVLVDEEKVPAPESPKKESSFAELLEHFWRLDEDAAE
ncbi:MAG: hypothetical protein ACI32F_00560 [Allobaculum sp.]